jgi:hypothetical protein
LTALLLRLLRLGSETNHLHLWQKACSILQHPGPSRNTRAPSHIEKGWKRMETQYLKITDLLFIPILSNIYMYLPHVTTSSSGLSMVPPWINSASASSARRCASDSWASKASMPQFYAGKKYGEMGTSPYYTILNHT